MKPSRRMWAGLILGLATAAVTWVPINNPSDAAAVIQRDKTGEWLRQESTPLRLGWSVHAGSLHTTGGIWTSDETAQATDQIHISRIWILNHSTGYMAHRIGRTIQEDLLQDPLLDEVAYFPASDLPLKIRRPPHLFIVLDADPIQESHWPWLHSIHTKVQVQVSRSPMTSPFPCDNDRRGPARIANLEFSFDAWGSITRSARFEGLANSVTVALDMHTLLEQWRDVDEPDVPLAWAGAIPEPPTDLDWLKPLSHQLLISQAPAPLLREHAWSIETSDSLENPLHQIRTQLVKDGWTTPHTNSVAAPDDPILQSVLAYKPQRILHLHTQEPSNPSKWVVHHYHGPTANELRLWLASRIKEVGQDASKHLALETLLSELSAKTRSQLQVELLKHPKLELDAELSDALTRRFPEGSPPANAK